MPIKSPSSLTLAVGMRVIVPFGRGNRRCEGIVLEVAEGDGQSLKCVERALDTAPVLSARQLHLAAFLRERYFCTFYDAAHAILPVGLWFHTMQTYTVLRENGDWHALTARNETAAAVMQALEDRGGCTDLSALRAQFPDEQALQAALRYLLARRLIEENVDMTQRAGEKTEKMARLTVPAEEAVALCRAQAEVRAAANGGIGAAVRGGERVVPRDHVSLPARRCRRCGGWKSWS